jgi:hypothetical protein
MRQSLIDLIDKTIIYQYSLDCPIRKIDKTVLTTTQDDCFDSLDNNNLAEIIYNSIIEYSFDEFDLTENDHNDLMPVALLTKLKYNIKASATSKISYGFFGEVLLYSMLITKYKTDTLISRGYFYNPLENSETKGYDSYHLIDNGEQVELWFGEVKFRASFSDGVKDAIDGLEKAINDEYLKTNIIAMVNHKDNEKFKNSKVKQIIDKWMKNSSINIINEVNHFNMKLIYPILIIYDSEEKDYDKKIRRATNYINTKFKAKKYATTINFDIFFIFLPLNETTALKKEVIEWIESKKPLMS